MLTTVLSGGSDQATRVDTPSMRPQVFIAKNEDPASPGNPASILPFLTAQANSVFSITSESEANFAGDISTSPTLVSKSEKGFECKDSDVSVGLDLGNGWKVVGLTPLADVAPQVSLAAQQQLGDPGLHTRETPAPAGINTVCSNAGSIGAAVYNMNSAPLLSTSVSGEWKIVGLTSLNAHSVSEADSVKTVVSSDNEKVAVVPVQNSDLLARTVPSADVLNHAWGQSTTASDMNSEDPVMEKTLPSNFQIPSLTHLAAGTSDWKIAGITTMQVSAGTVAANGSETASVAPIAAPTSPAIPSVPVTSAADMPEWKVVCVTSLNSPPANPPTVIASTLTPIPVIMAAATPLVTVPMPQVVIARDNGWKVVGMVPLPQSGQATSELCNHSDAVAASKLQPSSLVSEPPGQAQNNTWASNLLHQALDSAAQSSGSTSVAQFPSNTNIAQFPSSTSVKQFPRNTGATQFPTSRSVQQFASRMTQQRWVSSKLTRNTHNRVWPPNVLPQQREDSNHPLSFLKNCSNQFRNAVLKKNTVSTMLKLKRAFQNKSDDDKMLTFWSRKKVYALNKQSRQRMTLSGCRHVLKSVSHDDGLRENSDTSHTSQFPHRITDAEQLYNSCPESNKPVSPTGSLVAVAADDRVVLSSVYRAQTESQNSDTAPGNGNSSTSFSHLCGSSQDTEQLGLPGEHVDENSKSSLDGCLQAMKTEDGQGIVNKAGFDSDSVNLTTVDPWGVCTDEDLGRIAEMMSDKGRNQISHSSSRKRKLSTPRKMVQ